MLAVKAKSHPFAVIANRTVAEFVRRFEAEFQPYLNSPRLLASLEGRLPVLYTSHFSICPGEHKYSDWDLQCVVDSELITLPALKSIEKFVRTFPSFNNPGLILTPFEAHTSYTYHHLNTKSVLQIIAFMEKEETAPFADIHVANVPNSLLRAAHPHVSGQEFIDWIMVGYWRKRLNGVSYEDLSGRLRLLLPCFPRKEQEAISVDPLGFFKKHLEERGYNRVINFLQIARAAAS